MRAFFSLFYGLVAYLFFLATFGYAIAFVGDLPLVPTSVDRGNGAAPLLQALLVNLGLLSVFALQHSIMARRSFKAWWTRFVPDHLERSTYVLAASAALALLMAFWRPVPQPVVWDLRGPVTEVLLQLVFWSGWGMVLVSTFLINHFDLFGLRQVWADWRGRALPAHEFRTPLLYRHVRHPIYLGFVLAFWATPLMTAGHLLFAVATTGYILVGIWFEERDLVAQYGERYRAYRAQVGMLLPRLHRPRVQQDPAAPH